MAGNRVGLGLLGSKVLVQGHLASTSGSYDPKADPVVQDELAALLTALVRADAPAADSELEFAARLAQADPAATDALAAWLEGALAPNEPAQVGADQDGAR